MAGALLFIPQHVADEQAPAHHRGRVALHLTTALASARGDLAGAGAGTAHLVALEPQPRRCRGAGRARQRLRAARAACPLGHLSPRRRGHSAQQLEFSPEQEEGLLNACQMIVAVASVIHSLKLTLTLALNLPNPSSNPNP
eukprot:scaffold53292_cov60-Phaeocystis_antarctica.AAC.3